MYKIFSLFYNYFVYIDKNCISIPRKNSAKIGEFIDLVRSSHRLCLLNCRIFRKRLSENFSYVDFREAPGSVRFSHWIKRCYLSRDLLSRSNWDDNLSGLAGL